MVTFLVEYKTEKNSSHMLQKIIFKKKNCSGKGQNCAQWKIENSPISG
jgi:hypothetical protein